MPFLLSESFDLVFACRVCSHLFARCREEDIVSSVLERRHKTDCACGWTWQMLIDPSLANSSRQPSLISLFPLVGLLKNRVEENEEKQMHSSWNDNNTRTRWNVPARKMTWAELLRTQPLWISFLLPFCKRRVDKLFLSCFSN